MGGGAEVYQTVGTTHSLGNSDGTDTNKVSFLGTENPWGNKYELMSGIHSNNSIYYIYDGYQQPDQIPTTLYRTVDVKGNYRDGNISKMFYGKYGDLIPILVGG